jgi:phosphoglycerol transferase MdoB-like AlkP superfamily enzyme
MIDLKYLKYTSSPGRKSRLKMIFSAYACLMLFSMLYRMLFYFYFRLPDSETPDWWAIFSLGLRFDLRATSIVLLPTLIYVLYFLRSKIRKWTRRFYLFFQWLFCLAYIFLLSVDFGHYSYLKQRVNSSLLDVMANTRISSDMLYETYPVISGSFALLFSTSLLIFLIYRSQKKYLTGHSLGLVQFSTLPERTLCFLLLLPLCYGKLSYFPLRWSDAYVTTDNFINQLSLNPLPYFLETLSVKDSSYNTSAAKLAFERMKSYLNLPENQPLLQYKRSYSFSLAPGEKPVSYIFLQMESMSHDKSSMSNNPLDPTPELKKIASESLYFPHFFSPTEATARGLYAVLTGLPDVTFDKSSSRNPQLVDQDLIFNQMSEYKKFYFLGGSANWGNIRSLWSGNIKDIHIHEEGSYHSPRVDVWGISDLSLFKEALEVLAKEKGVTLSYIQSAGFHRPYTIPDDNDHFKVRTDINLATVKKYGFLSLEEYNSMRFQDHALGVFFKLLKESPLYPNVVVAIYGDHGLPSDRSDHIPSAHYANQVSRVVNHHIPLVIFAPSRSAPAVRSDVVGSLVDVVPTSLSIGKTNFYTSTLGRNLLEARKPENNNVFLFSFHEKPKHISMIDEQYLWLHRTGSEIFMDYQHNLDPVVDPALTERAANLKTLSESVYETVKFIRYHNQKRH